MGMALIVFFVLFILTISSGTINGIILYAFVIRTYERWYFFSPPSSGAFAKVLSVFIAWLKIDFGIETCFYHGMTSYSKVWLQLSFPLYMVTLLIIIASKWSSTVSKICGYNMVSVISTLIVLFYAKQLRVLTIIFTYAEIKHAYVWCYDGTVPYLGLEHAFLFIAGLLVTMFFILPYTAVMLLTPC